MRRKKRKTRGKRNQRSGELEAEDPDDDNPRVECAKFAGCLRECQELIDCAKVFAELDSLPKDLSIDSDGLALVTDITRKIVTVRDLAECACS